MNEPWNDFTNTTATVDETPPWDDFKTDEETPPWQDYSTKDSQSDSGLKLGLADSPPRPESISADIAEPPVFDPSTSGAKPEEIKAATIRPDVSGNLNPFFNAEDSMTPSGATLSEWHPTLWQKFRNSTVGRKILGDTTYERELKTRVGGGEPSLGVIDPILNNPANPFLPGAEGKVGKAIMGYFLSQSIKHKPEQVREIKRLFDAGDQKSAWREVLGATIGLGFDTMMAHGLKEGFTPRSVSEPPASASTEVNTQLVKPNAELLPEAAKAVEAIGGKSPNSLSGLYNKLVDDFNKAKAVIGSIFPNIKITLIPSGKGGKQSKGDIQISPDGKELQISQTLLDDIKSKYPDNSEEVLRMVVGEEIIHHNQFKSLGSDFESKLSDIWNNAPIEVQKAVRKAYGDSAGMESNHWGAELLRMVEQIRNGGKTTESIHWNAERRASAAKATEIIKDWQSNLGEAPKTPTIEPQAQDLPTMGFTAGAKTEQAKQHIRQLDVSDIETIMTEFESMAKQAMSEQHFDTAAEILKDLTNHREVWQEKMGQHFYERKFPEPNPATPSTEATTAETAKVEVFSPDVISKTEYEGLLDRVRISSEPDIFNKLGVISKQHLKEDVQRLERMKADLASGKSTLSSGVKDPISTAITNPELRKVLEQQRDLMSEGDKDDPLNIIGRLKSAKPATDEVLRLESGAKPVKTQAQPELVGMGGALPKEFEQSAQTPTSIKNAQVDIERAKHGLPPAIEPIRRSFGRVWDEAMARIDSDPSYPDRLINELRDKPRSLTDAEDATILHRQVDLQNEYGKATRDLAQAYDDGRMDAVGDQQARVAAISDQLLDLYNIGKKVGTETGRGLNARKMMAYEDFSLAKMELEKRAEKGGAPLTPKERNLVVELNKRIEETQNRYDEYVSKTDARIADLEVKRALDEVEQQSKREPVVSKQVQSLAQRIVTVLDTQASAARARLQEKFGRMSSGVDPTIIADLAIIGASHIARGAFEFGAWSKAMLEEIGETVTPYLKDAYDAANKHLDMQVDRFSKGKGEPVKRAVRKLDVSEQTQAAKDTIKTRIDSGRRDEITPTVQKLARLFVEQGITEREALVDDVHNFLQEVDPNITRREAMDAISGYGEFKQLTKDEISLKLRDLKGQMQQVAKLEDMQAKRPPLKTGIERRIPSPEESRLIKLVNQAKNEFQIPIDDPNTQLKSSLDELKTRLNNRTIEFQDKLARGDFAKKPKRVLQMDAEANKLHFEMSKAKADWHEALMLDRLANRSMPQKVLGTAGEVLNTSRAIITSMDLSAVLRQGGFIGFAHPIRAAKSFPAMFKALISEAGQHAVDQEIVSRKNYPLYNQGKLYLSEHGQKLSQMEEAYMSRWSDKIPLVAASQRAYVTFLNKLRADSFDAMAKTLARNKELSPTEVSAIANFVNVATGRGNFGMKENALVGLNTVFFAPRYVASRFQLIAGQPLYRGTARTRTLIAGEYARYLIGVGLLYALAQQMGASIETDPRSSDFGKIKFGNTRIDPLSGLSQTSVLLSRLISGETKKSNGQIIPIRGEKVPFGSPKASDVIANFLRSKLSPVVGAGVNIATGTDVVGQPVTAASTAQNLLIPLSFQDIYKTMQEQGIPKGTAMALLSIFGMGLQTYQPRPEKPKPSAADAILKRATRIPKFTP